MLNRDTIAYRKFVGWWWPDFERSHGVASKSPSGEPRSQRKTSAKVGKFGIGSPYLRIWILLVSLAATPILIGVYLATGAAAANGESISFDLIVSFVWSFFNGALWMVLAFRRYVFRILAPLCAAVFGVIGFYATGFWIPLTIALFITPLFTRTPPADDRSKTLALFAVVVVPFLPVVMYGVTVPFR